MMRNINLKEEREYENRKVLGEDMRKNQSKYYWATELTIQKHKLKTYKTIRDKHILEIGCSDGKDASIYSQYASHYCGVDISDEAIKKAVKLQLANADFFISDGHSICKPDEEFDCIIVHGLLHHLSLEEALQEIYRLLKPNGILIFREPLGTNPIFQLYRSLTPSSRTKDERPFTFKDISLMKKLFKFESIEWYGFLNIISAFIRLDIIRRILTKCDSYISRTFLKYFFWQISGFARKK